LGSSELVTLKAAQSLTKSNCPMIESRGQAAASY
jgi:hypothetical protein